MFVPPRRHENGRKKPLTAKIAEFAQRTLRKALTTGYTGKHGGKRGTTGCANPIFRADDRRKTGFRLGTENWEPATGNWF